MSLTLKKKVALYEAELNILADWDRPDTAMSQTDDNGASARWARDLLKKAGVVPIQDKQFLGDKRCLG